MQEKLYKLLERFNSEVFSKSIPSKAVSKIIKEGGFERLLKLHVDRQGKHIIGHKNYIPGKSIFNGTVQDAQKLIDKFVGTGKFFNEELTRERVDFGEIIGTYVKGNGEFYTTTNGIIHYSKKGVHIIPSNPHFEKIGKK